jgi:Arc/MetJ family transcription regulator
MHRLLILCIKKGGANMRTTLDIPDNLIKEAMKATHIKTKTKVIITALEQLIRRAQLSEIKEFKGKINLDIDLETIRGRKCRF